MECGYFFIDFFSFPCHFTPHSGWILVTFALITPFRMTSWSQVRGNIGSGSFTISTRTVPPYLIMSWLQWSFHINAPTKGKNSEKPASLWKNENWLLCFDSSVCGCHSFISMFSLFCCAPPDTNENVPWDLNRFWMNYLLHWFTPGAVIYFSPVSFLDSVRTPILIAKMLFWKRLCASF